MNFYFCFMDNLFALCLFLFILIIPNTGEAVVILEKSSKSSISNGWNADDLINLDRKEIEKKIGRKLKLREKIALKVIKAKVKKNVSHVQNQSNQQQKTDGFAIAGLLSSVLGFLGLILFSGSLAISFGLGIGILALIFSIIALKRIKHNPESKKGKVFALIGLFLGSALTLVSTIGAIGYLI